MKEIKIWFQYTLNSFQQTLYHRATVILFIMAKFFRIAVFLIFLHFLMGGIKELGGYNKGQVIFFYLSFNLVDSAAQLLFREVYRFRELIISGNFDFVLTKPLNPLIRVLLGGTDILDLILLVLIIVFTYFFAFNNLTISAFGFIGYILLILNGLLIAASFHIFVLALGILTTTIDHLIMVYRDVSNMARIPIDIYAEPVRSFLTFIVPIGIMFTFPPKVLMGLLSLQNTVIALLAGIVFFYLSLSYWKYALKKYQSASS